MGCGDGRPFPPERPDKAVRRLPHLPARLVKTHSSFRAAKAQGGIDVRTARSDSACDPCGWIDGARACPDMRVATLSNFSKIYLAPEFVRESTKKNIKLLILLDMRFWKIRSRILPSGLLESPEERMSLVADAKDGPQNPAGVG